MSKELNALECLEALERDIKDRTILAEDRQLKLCAVIKQALLELQSIKEANPSEALKCLDKLVKQIELDEDTDYWEIRNAHITVEQALLKAREQEKEKLLFKNIHNTKVKTPLVSIFEGISKDERFKFTEHIYYHWEEMKEALEDKNNELEKENELLKEIIKSFFDRGCPLHQYTDKAGTLQIEVDDECSTMHLGKFKDVDLDKKLKEVLE